MIVYQKKTSESFRELPFQFMGGGVDFSYYDDEYIHTSGQWVAPKSGFYSLLLIGGGAGGVCFTALLEGISGSSGEMHESTVFMESGEVASVTIGSPGKTFVYETGSQDKNLEALGGETKFISGEQVISVAGGGINYIPSRGYIDHCYIAPHNSVFWSFPGGVSWGVLDTVSSISAHPRYTGIGHGGAIHTGTVGFHPRSGGIRIRHFRNINIK